MHAVLFSVVGWIFREVLVKFVVLAAIYAVMVVLMPIVVELAAPFVSGTTLTNLFAAMPAGVWYFLDWMQAGFGIPLVLSAAVAAFTIRRLPVIG